jgi:hypothetical protein
MNEIDDLLERIDTPPTDVSDDVARGERALGRRRRWQISGAAVSVVAVAALVAAAQGAGPGSSDAGFAGQPGAAGPTSTAQAKLQLAKQQHSRASKSPQTQTNRAHRQLIEAKKRLRHLQNQLSAGSTDKTLQSYHDILAAHLDPTGDKLRLAQNEQAGGGTFGTKLDWNGGGMLEIVVGRSWASAGGFYILESAHMTDTTFRGLPARVSTAGSDLVVSVRHADGTVVTLIASTSFGNNGTSTASLDLTQAQLLDAAADPKLQLPPRLQ